jgi:hypothetical protein
MLSERKGDGLKNFKFVLQNKGYKMQDAKRRRDGVKLLNNLHG